MPLSTKIIKSLSYGFVSGFCVGCVPNTLCVEFKHKKYNSLSIPLVTGLVCSVGLIVSPLLIVNYFCNGTYFDQLVDNYDIRLNRYHQYDGNDNKYAFPSVLILSINPKNKNEPKKREPEPEPDPEPEPEKKRKH